jgi:hypothetical protein
MDEPRFGMLIDHSGWHGGLGLLGGMAGLAGAAMVPVWAMEARPVDARAPAPAKPDSPRKK